MDETHTRHEDLALSDQVAALLESTTLLQRKLAQVLSQISVQSNHPYAASQSQININAPASAQASILGPGVPIPSRGWQMDHSPKKKVFERTKLRLMKDGWPDCDDTDMHAWRLTDAMLRMGMEDMDNFATEASRLNCSNMAISATLVSAVVATFISETYSNNDSLHMRVVNSLWLLSLLLSLATATLCMLVSEWLTWSTSQELRDMSILYRLIRTAFRSLLMHTSIFLFFAGLMVLMWNESPAGVCIVPSIAVGLFIIYYVTASVRSSFVSFFGTVNQWDEHDFRGLRVQIWTPFSLGTWHTMNYTFMYVVNPFKRFIRSFSSSEKVNHERQRRPTLNGDVSEFTIPQKISTPIHEPIANAVTSDHITILPAHPPPLPTLAPTERSPVRGRPLHAHQDSLRVESPQVISRIGSPASTAPTEFVDPEQLEHQRKLRAIRLRRLTEHEILRPVRSARAPDV